MVSWHEEWINETGYVCVSLSDSQTVLADWCHEYGLGSTKSGRVAEANKGDQENMFWLIEIERSTGGIANLAKNIKCLVRITGDYKSIHCSFEL